MKKNILLLIVVALAFGACTSNSNEQSNSTKVTHLVDKTSDNDKIKQINERIQNNPFKIDVSPKTVKFEQIKKLHFIDVAKIYEATTRDNISNKDSLSFLVNYWAKVAENYKKENDKDNYYAYLGKVKFLRSIEGLSDADECINVYKYIYSGYNPFLGKRQEVTTYALFDGKGKIITYCHEDNLKEFQDDTLNNPDFAYILLIVEEGAK